MYFLMLICGPMPEVHQETTSSREEPHATQTAAHYPFNQYGRAYSFGAFAESHPLSLPSLHGREGFAFPGFATPDDMVKSVVGIKPDDSSVMTGYHVEFI